MIPFLAQITDKIIQENPDFSNTIWVFPSKRAGVFAANYLKKNNSKTIFAPEFLSIEAFIGKLAIIEPASTETALCLLYESYLETDIKEKESFSSFIGWGTTILQDFNEIDRYGVVAKKLYTHIQNLQEVSHWALEEDKTEMVQAYLKFWEILPELYERFTEKMLAQDIGHQGLLYKKAKENIAQFLKDAPNTKFYFIGFNALNTSESDIIQYILSEKRGAIYWDLDQYFLENLLHEAGYFMRQHLKKWPYFKENTPEGISHEYLSTEKKITIYGVPKSVSQAQLIGEILNDLPQEQVLKTAIVLGDEELLNPAIHAIPTGLKANITMGAPLSGVSMAALVARFFDLHTSNHSKGWHIQQVQDVLTHPYIKPLVEANQYNAVKTFVHHCKKQNISSLNTDYIKAYFEKSEVEISLLFKDKAHDPVAFVARFKALLNVLFNFSEKNKLPQISSEVLYFREIFEGLSLQLTDFPFIDNLSGLKKIYLETISKKRLSFSGDALEGLQLMGMLESRNLDFETVIISHVNEGILPGGKSSNSYIPLSLKRTFGLPSFKEKDAVYAYHFYRLLQRAKNVYLLYNTATDVLEGGEPSRFIHQLKTQGIDKVQVVHQLAMPVLDAVTPTLMEVEKDPSVIEKLLEKAKSGFSPSALNTYIRNPIDFYKRYILKLKDPEILEELIAYNTFGTIVHDSLEALYTPCIGQILTENHFKEINTQLPNTLAHFFEKHHSPTQSLKGKNLIAFSVLLQYLKDFLDYDQECAKKEEIYIESLEKEYQMTLQIPGVSQGVLFKGSLDRVDKRNGVTHIIDFKTGAVKSTELKLKDWDGLKDSPEKAKIFQLLSYAALYMNEHGKTPVKTGIYSFKNKQDGYMFLEDSLKSSDKNIVDEVACSEFKEVLIEVVQELFNIENSFVEKKV
jgi:hypothetical protein